MKFEPRLDPPTKQSPLVAKLGWMLLYWAGGVGVVAIVGLIIRFWLN